MSTIVSSMTQNILCYLRILYFSSLQTILKTIVEIVFFFTCFYPQFLGNKIRPFFHHFLSEFDLTFRENFA